MTDPKTLAIQGCDAALVAAIQNATTILISAFIQAKTDADRDEALDRHHAAIRLCKDVHGVSRSAIEEIFTSQAVG